jgi:hypothetical protein
MTDVPLAANGQFDAQFASMPRGGGIGNLLFIDRSPLEHGDVSIGANWHSPRVRSQGPLELDGAFAAEPDPPNPQRVSYATMINYAGHESTPEAGKTGDITQSRQFLGSSLKGLVLLQE